MKYRLSKRQLKHLRMGRGLDIAIPAPWYEHHPARYFREVVEVDPRWIERVRPKVLTVNPVDSGSGETVQLIGSLINEPESLDLDLTLQVECIVGRLRASDDSRSQYPCQWPATVEY